MFKSALYPCVIEFTVKRDGTSARAGDTGSSSASTVAPGVLGSQMRSAEVSSDAPTASGTGGATGSTGENVGGVVENSGVVGSSASGRGRAHGWER